MESEVEVISAPMESMRDRSCLTVASCWRMSALSELSELSCRFSSCPVELRRVDVSEILRFVSVCSFFTLSADRWELLFRLRTGIEAWISATLVAIIADAMIVARMRNDWRIRREVINCIYNDVMNCSYGSY